jgi:hypothetical protein
MATTTQQTPPTLPPQPAKTYTWVRVPIFAVIGLSVLALVCRGHLGTARAHEIHLQTVVSNSQQGREPLAETGAGRRYDQWTGK